MYLWIYITSFYKYIYICETIVWICEIDCTFMSYRLCISELWDGSGLIHVMLSYGALECKDWLLIARVHIQHGRDVHVGCYTNYTLSNSLISVHLWNRVYIYELYIVHFWIMRRIWPHTPALHKWCNNSFMINLPPSLKCYNFYLSNYITVSKMFIGRF